LQPAIDTVTQIRNTFFMEWHAILESRICHSGMATAADVLRGRGFVHLRAAVCPAAFGIDQRLA
jgi:hypothetical protein